MQDAAWILGLGIFIGNVLCVLCLGWCTWDDYKMQKRFIDEHNKKLEEKYRKVNDEV